MKKNYTGVYLLAINSKSSYLRAYINKETTILLDIQNEIFRESDIDTCLRINLSKDELIGIRNQINALLQNIESLENGAD